MIRIGLSRWFIQIEKRPAQRGQVEIILRLIPQAPRFRILAKHWRGVNCDLVEKEVFAEAQSEGFCEEKYDLDRNPVREMTLIRRAAETLAARAVEHCLRLGIVDYEGFDKGAALYIVLMAVMSRVQRGESDPLEPQECVDLVADMRAIRAERERQREERERLAREAYEAHLQDMEARERARPETQVAFELLYSVLSPSEAKEAREKGRVTLTNVLGEFVVPVSHCGLVRRFVNGQYEGSYCIVFKDFSIPLGDEVLMKVALLRIDPHKFIRTANRFFEKHFRR